jgi:dienelactone hydrolase
MEWRSDDPDSTPGPRTGVQALMGLVAVIAPASAGESTGMQWTSPADFERGTIVFRLVTHDGQKNVYHSTARVTVAGNYLFDKYPRELLKSGRDVVDVVVMSADTSARPAPGLLYVPPAGVSARACMRQFVSLVSIGNTVAVVSLPGAGRSGGRADEAGPASVAAVDAAIARLAKDPSVDPKRIGIWGVEDGATTALLAAVKHPELQAVIAQDAAYDAWAAYRALPADARRKYVREAGSDSAGWRARSPLIVATKVPVPVLVLQTNEASAPDSASAQAFANARSDQQLFIESRIGRQGSRPFMSRDAVRVGQEFLRRRLHHP